MPRTSLALRRCGGVLALVAGGVAGAQTLAPAAGDAPLAPCDVKRPPVNFNRWNENWGVLADPCLPRQPFDGLKYIPLGADGLSYLSLGGGLRERYEHIATPLFGAGSAPADGYVIQRANVHADLRLGSYVQVFGQLVDARAFQKRSMAPPDQDKLDVEQLFVTVAVPTAEGAIKVRAGRQEMAFDLQRFIAVRDGPNVRQAFDGVWADWEHGPWRLIGYVTQPVQNRSVDSFDDYSNGHLTLNGIRVERQGVGPGDVSGYYSRYRRDSARFLDAQGDERRDVYDLRYSGKRGNADFDVEGMLQHGEVGARRVSAWAIGSIAGYTFAGTSWTPRVGVQFDMASGDRHAGDGKLGTFNPLFANGYYFSLAGLTGYSNLVHLKPSVTVKPLKVLSVTTALGLQWRQTTGDAVYVQSMAGVPRTAGQGGRWTGAYAQLRTDWIVSPNVTASLEAVHFQAGDSLRAAGGGSANYLGMELKFGW
ncbi:Alginate export [Duganella sp. CF517]|uniref:alginate export family protein n=1 Tax=Duganella sp. CF517 TaxID=1881038 RepID=UPI0008B655E5|nr:alginate export family protein [Duganella sp. CF517]SEO32991.1 Alginate export [Duganella sp. CF517]